MEEEALGRAYDARLIRRLMKYLRPYRPLVAVSVVVLAAHSLLQVAGPYLTKVAIDKYLKPTPASSPLDAFLSAGRFEGLSQIAPHAHMLKLKNKDFSRDPKVVEEMNNDPLIAHEVQPTHTVAEMVRADERLKKEFPLITLPVLILHGTGDKLTKPAGSRLFYDKAGSTDKTLKLYEGYAHDLLNDIGKEKVMADIIGWIDAHLLARVGAIGVAAEVKLPEDAIEPAP